MAIKAKGGIQVPRAFLGSREMKEGLAGADLGHSPLDLMAMEEGIAACDIADLMRSMLLDADGQLDYEQHLAIGIDELLDHCEAEVEAEGLPRDSIQSVVAVIHRALERIALERRESERVCTERENLVRAATILKRFADQLRAGGKPVLLPCWVPTARDVLDGRPILTDADAFAAECGGVQPQPSDGIDPLWRSVGLWDPEVNETRAAALENAASVLEQALAESKTAFRLELVPPRKHRGRSAWRDGLQRYCRSKGLSDGQSVALLNQLANMSGAVQDKTAFSKDSIRIRRRRRSKKTP